MAEKGIYIKLKRGISYEKIYKLNFNFINAGGGNSRCGNRE